MKKIQIFIALLGIVTILGSCSSDDAPYIIFNDQHGEINTSDIIDVALNSNMELFVSAGFEEAKGEHNMIHYERQINDGTIVDLTFTGTLDILTVGVHNNLIIEKAQISLSFDEETVVPGDMVKIIARDNGTLRNTVVFKIK